MIKTFYCIAAALVFSATASAQETCEVSVEPLKGTYTGDCEKGKANGKGKAVGTDTYEGNFKKGYPEGSGKYTWKNGDSYTGTFKKGLKEGKGEMNSTENGKAKVVTGFWKKDEYMGKYEKPYILHGTTSNVGRVEINRQKSTRSNITIEVQSLLVGGGAIQASTRQIGLTDIRIVTGTFNTKITNRLSNKQITVLQNVIFPFKAVFVFENSQVDVEFFEDGEWTMTVPIQVQ